MLRRRNRINDGDLGLTDQIDDRLRHSVQENVNLSFFESNKIVDIHDVSNDDSEDGGSKSSENGEEIHPR